MTETTTITGADKLPDLYDALAQAQAEFLPIEKNREGQDGNRKFMYADLGELIQKTRPALAKHKLCVIQLPSSKPDGSHELRTILAHASGATIECTIDLPKVFDGIKKFGGAITFLRRYAYQAVLCISADDDLDDDGRDRAESAQQARHPAAEQQVRMPQRREPLHRESERKDQEQETRPATDQHAYCTEGEVGWLQRRIDAAGIDWAEAHRQAGLPFTPGKPLSKKSFAAIKGVI